MNRISFLNPRKKLIQVTKRLITNEPHSEHDLKIDYLKRSLEFLNKPNYYDQLVIKHPYVSKLRRCSILIPITVKQEKNKKGLRVQKTFFTLTQRADTIKFKGEVCFVGGSRENKTDTNDVSTALREAKEEININEKSLSILAQFCPIMTTKGDLVTPIIAYFDENDYEPIIDHKEVSQVFKLPTERFILNEGYTCKKFKAESTEYYLHYFNDTINGKAIQTWGLTAFVSILVSSLLHSRMPDFQLDPDIKLTDESILGFLDLYLEKTIQSADKTKLFNQHFKQE
jgi:8-oxo-dGTP pyrophosphatase MutT (NUDIX family)